MNGLQEGGVSLIASAMVENYEPQSKRQKVESDEEAQINFQTLISSSNTELGKCIKQCSFI